MPAFKPVPPELAEHYLGSFPDDSRIERRRMFGCPCAFVNGNMFSGLHEDRLVLRLPAVERERVLKAGEARAFEVMGRTMREYVVLPAPLSMTREQIRQWIARALDFGASLPPKKSKAKPGVGIAARRPRKTQQDTSKRTTKRPPKGGTKSS